MSLLRFVHGWAKNCQITTTTEFHAIRMTFSNKQIECCLIGRWRPNQSAHAMHLVIETVSCSNMDTKILIQKPWHFPD